MAAPSTRSTSPKGTPVQHSLLRRRPSVIPGFGVTLGLTLFWLALIVLVPLAGLAIKSAELTPTQIYNILTSRRVAHALGLSFGLSALAAVINLIFGTILAWVLVRYRFWGRGIADALVDIPFALPTAVAGIALTDLYGPNGLLGSALGQIGIKVAFTPLGILIALIFIGLPFVVRTVQPVLMELSAEVEEAAATLGASRWQVIRRVIAPTIIPALLTGAALSFARGVGEYGSVIFIAGNLPNVSEIAPLLIVIKLEEFKYADATAIALAMLIAAFLLLLPINWLQRWSDRRTRRA
ncbi:sulfate ABC transporter permease subunit CysT [Lacibacterium aquatile]|uniref:Sulfate transport system permease protein CysT n=1 Tax=Lacibacterium aquatile TaxID=1168082 RepID=A0ABW5DMF0_9PROT